MRPRNHQYCVHYYDDDNEYVSHTLSATSVEQVKLKMETHYPGADISVIYELIQVWGKG